MSWVDDDQDFALVKLLKGYYLTNKEFYTAVGQIFLLSVVVSFFILAVTGNL